ncbi:MAG: hypothetical protein JWM53_3996, partial [bacterium]|nr:hypothetical protein [bacterium]
MLADSLPIVHVTMTSCLRLGPS